MADNAFKNRLFGGFDRKDVVNYIEKLASERNDLQVRCRELEKKLSDAEDKLENLQSELEAQKEGFASEKESLVSEYEAKLIDSETRVAEANARADEKHDEERSRTYEALSEVVNAFSDAESDIQLLITHILEDVRQTDKAMKRLPEILKNSRERIEDIKDSVK